MERRAGDATASMPGTGADSVSYSGRSGNVTVTLGGGADDGEAGEGDDVGTDAEQADGGNGNDVLVANNLGNTLNGGRGKRLDQGRDRRGPARRQRGR